LDNTEPIIEEDEDQKWRAEDFKHVDANDDSLDGCILEEEGNADENQ
jgi:hypothetical protein